mmetsp:Transcript_22580/g.27841  ORF Transcript_22580/g.27841 Transcript_22580/m.27841 type:complete len:91 (+) Transcript_22580:226-498(+)
MMNKATQTTCRFTSSEASRNSISVVLSYSFSADTASARARVLKTHLSTPFTFPLVAGLFVKSVSPMSMLNSHLRAVFSNQREAVHWTQMR